MRRDADIGAREPTCSLAAGHKQPGEAVNIVDEPAPDNSPGHRGAFVSTDAILPDARVGRTSRAQPDGSSASRKNSEPPLAGSLDTRHGRFTLCMYRQV